MEMVVVASVSVIPRTTRVLVLDLEIPGEPVPRQRAARTRAGRSYTPLRMAAQEELIGLLARGRVQTPTADPIILEADFFLGNKRRADLSNFLKLAEDALNGVAWDDDSQVIEAHVHKHFDKTFPRTVLRVWRVPT